MNRRSFLRGLVGGSALAVGGAPITAFATPPNLAHNQLSTPWKVLEVYLDGGLSAFCTLLGKSYSLAGARQIYDNVPGTSYSGWAPRWSSVTPTGTTLQGQYTDNTGHPYAFIDGLNALATSSQGFRVAVMRHDLTPHEAARPYTLTGNTLGRPQMAGTGNAVNLLNSPNNASFVLHHNRMASALEASAPGLFGGGSTPIILQYDRGFDGNDVDTDIPPDRLAQLDFDRTALPAAGDLRDHFYGAYSDKLMEGANRVRSAAFDAAQGSWQRSSNLSTDHAYITQAGTAQDCDDIYQDCAVGLVRGAAHLLNNSSAQYAMVVAEGFDTHGLTTQSFGSNSHAFMHGAHLARLLNGVMGSVNLSTTLVVFTTEFGRVATPNGSLEDAHWPHGYAQLAIGGPIPTGGPHVVGHLGDDGKADPLNSVTPAEFRAAVLYAAGIDAVAALGSSPDTMGTSITNQGADAYTRLFS